MQRRFWFLFNPDGWFRITANGSSHRSLCCCRRTLYWDWWSVGKMAATPALLFYNPVLQYELINTRTIYMSPLETDWFGAVKICKTLRGENLCLHTGQKALKAFCPPVPVLSAHLWLTLRENSLNLAPTWLKSNFSRRSIRTIVMHSWHYISQRSAALWHHGSLHRPAIIQRRNLK